MALAWLLANPVVTAPIIGPRTREQLDGWLRALEIKLDASARQVGRIFPGPGKPAPEAYAWCRGRRRRLLLHSSLPIDIQPLPMSISALWPPVLSLCHSVSRIFTLWPIM